MFPLLLVRRVGLRGRLALVSYALLPLAAIGPSTALLSATLAASLSALRHPLAPAAVVSATPTLSRQLKGSRQKADRREEYEFFHSYVSRHWRCKPASDSHGPETSCN